MSRIGAGPETQYKPPRLTRWRSAARGRSEVQGQESRTRNATTPGQRRADIAKWKIGCRGGCDVELIPNRSPNHHHHITSSGTHHGIQGSINKAPRPNSTSYITRLYTVYAKLVSTEPHAACSCAVHAVEVGAAVIVTVCGVP